MTKKHSSSKEKKNPAISDGKTGKEAKLFNNILKTTQQFIQGKCFLPVTFGELYTKLHLHEQHKDILLEVLETLTKSGIIESVRGKYVCTTTQENTITGTLRLHPRGFGFVKPEDSTAYSQDIFIPKHLTERAIDGDTVEVLVNNESISEKGPEGRITAILSRGRTHLAGIIREIGRNETYYAYAPLLGMAQKVAVETAPGETLTIGDRIVMEVIEWGNKESPTEARLSRRLGHISDASCDIPAAIEEYELRKDFPIKAVNEAHEFGTRVSTAEIKKREDLRSLTCFTIDPDTAKDFDDAISLSKEENGHYHLGVHIADVSHYVSPGTHLDIEAQMRCNSTYFPGFCLPMLPRELSDNLCSLKPNVNRLTVSVLMEFDPTGTLVNYRMTRSVIKSDKRFTYKEAKAVLDGVKSSPHEATLRLMVEMCGLLKKKRYERGSIEFGLPELVILVDEKGVPTGTDYVTYDITHQLVEEFMLKANETVAWHLTNEGKGLTYRVHDEPSEENMKDFALLAGAFGFHLSPTPTPKEIQELFKEAMETPYGEYLATSYIRRMRLAVYSADNIGHYGLSLLHYCHFTSPIRRYVDLVAHRILLGEISDKEKLEMIAARCSEQERISAKAENSVTLLKKLRLLDANHKKDKRKEYQAVITRVKNFGIYFEVLELMLESYLHVSELENDYYVYDEVEIILKGRHHGQIYRAGDKITVMLKDVDLITLESKWDLLVNEGSEVPAASANRKPGKKRSGKIISRKPPKPQREPGKKQQRRRK
ncbi:MAG: VacB/RNase II family 3'-5' exoribonuclease [Parachlamydiaceae bacterium]